ncbi:SDR family oxidoreductase [Arthrobacter sp.]|uniref:SDR family oxidoreductase n=1 Tax=Arthrobacter sp. TaxID=1667 RepID=UPI00339AE46B
MKPLTLWSKPAASACRYRWTFDQVDRLAAAAVRQFGSQDIAVASADILRRAPLDEMTDDAWNDMLSVDLTGVLRMFRSCARLMGEGGGSMVAVSSIAGGVCGWDDHAH